MRKHYPPEQEPELIKKAAAGCEKSFERLIDRHELSMRKAINRVLRNEVLSERNENSLWAARLLIWRGLSCFKGNSTFGTWVFSIAANSARTQLRELRSSRLEVQHVQGADLDGQQENEWRESEVESREQDVTNGGEDLADQGEMLDQRRHLAMINQLLEAVEPQSRDWFIRHRVDGEAITQLARESSVGHTRVRQAIRDVEAHIREHVDR